MPIRGKKVTPTVAAGSARTAREVDAGSRGEGGDARGGSRAPRVISARRRARVGRVRKTARCVHEYKYAKKGKRSQKLSDAALRRLRGDAPSRISARRGRGTLVCHHRARHSSHAPGGVLARPREGSGVPRAASGEYGVLIGRERAQNAEAAD